MHEFGSYDGMTMRRGVEGSMERDLKKRKDPSGSGSGSGGGGTRRKRRERKRKGAVVEGGYVCPQSQCVG